MLKRLLLVIITTVSICTIQAQTGKSKYRILVYGLPDFLRQNAEDVIANKWGIEFYPVGDCSTPQEIADSAEKHNTAIKALIAKKYGRQWSKRFDEEVDAEFAVQQKIAPLIDSIDYIKNKQAEMEKEGNGLHYYMTPIAGTTKYNVQVQGWGTWNGQSEWVTYYRFVANHKTKEVTLISNKIEKE
ncbi:hypothetical protein LL912_19080 [Niabella sp. CC-SYL272]|uniref:FEKKY domain-containing protein n=1 Tax=Niabella agricola TaxID=2891571 RepID=UPI001F3BFC4D|nr:hypothetical protein [Niabella agricola]MCF3110897.1 hypothetical protein [Niabella agricola]